MAVAGSCKEAGKKGRRASIDGIQQDSETKGSVRVSIVCIFGNREVPSLNLQEQPYDTDQTMARNKPTGCHSTASTPEVFDDLQTGFRCRALIIDVFLPHV